MYWNGIESERAVEMLALALTHSSNPTRWMEKWMLLDRWKKELEETLGAYEYAIAWECGSKIELNSVITAMQNSNLH